MTALYTFDAFCSVDGFGSFTAGGGWGGYWGKQTREFLEYRESLFSQNMHMVLGARTY